MAAYPRSHYIREGEIATCHVWSRCVQQAFLCGKDPVTGYDYNYRREWIESLIEYQAGVFAVDVGNYNILSNHEHLLARTRPDISNSWPDEEVAWRWAIAWPEWTGNGWEARPSDEKIRLILADPERLGKARKNLGSLSWFMARVKEPIAKLANAEMGRTGHFYEGRFKCRRLDDPPAVLTGWIYMDINQIAGQMAPSLEASNCSAVQRRIAEWMYSQAKLSVEEFHKIWRADVELTIQDVLKLLNCNFLSPISNQGPLILLNDSASPQVVSQPTSLWLGPTNVGDEPEGTVVESSPEAIESKSQLPQPDMTLVDVPASEQLEPDMVAQGAEPVVAADVHELKDAALRVNRAGGSQRRRGARLSSSEKSSNPPTYEIHTRLHAKQKRRATDNPILDVPFEQYIALVFWSAARLKGEAFAEQMPPEVAAFLARVGINASQWMDVIGTFEQKFHGAIGRAETIARFLERTGRKFIHGINACRDAFT